MQVANAVLRGTSEMLGCRIFGAEDTESLVSHARRSSTGVPPAEITTYSPFALIAHSTPVTSSQILIFVPHPPCSCSLRVEQEQ
jgi:hypothetical protein